MQARKIKELQSQLKVARDQNIILQRRIDQLEVSHAEKNILIAELQDNQIDGAILNEEETVEEAIAEVATPCPDSGSEAVETGECPEPAEDSSENVSEEAPVASDEGVEESTEEV